jgi:hypothetical protein
VGCSGGSKVVLVSAWLGVVEAEEEDSTVVISPFVWDGEDGVGAARTRAVVRVARRTVGSADFILFNREKFGDVLSSVVGFLGRCKVVVGRWLEVCGSGLKNRNQRYNWGDRGVFEHFVPWRSQQV